jgi:hypothetical protein
LLPTIGLAGQLGLGKVSLQATAAGLPAAGFLRVGRKNKPVALRIAAKAGPRASSFDEETSAPSGVSVGRLERSAGRDAYLGGGVIRSGMRLKSTVDRLLADRDPAIRWRTRVHALGENRDEPRVRRLEEEVRRSTRARALLSHVERRHVPGTNRNVYYKWQGVHWVLGALADIGYPPRASELEPLADRALRLWLRAGYLRTIALPDHGSSRKATGVRVIRGRARRCGSQHGNCLRYLTVLDLADRERRAKLAELLEGWQWPDGGWNCDITPGADRSSFMETLLPMRGLAVYARTAHDRAAGRTAHRAAEVFLVRGLFRRRTDGRVIRKDFLRLPFPLYWHYDVLGGLVGLADAGRLRDPRAREALDWLEARRLPDGAWPADARFYRVSRAFAAQSDSVAWGPTGAGRPNAWVTVDALRVLREAGRWSP